MGGHPGLNPHAHPAWSERRPGNGFGGKPPALVGRLGDFGEGWSESFGRGAGGPTFLDELDRFGTFSLVPFGRGAC